MSYEQRKTRPRMTYNGRTFEIRSARYTPEMLTSVLDEYVAGGRPKHLSEKYGMPVSSIEKLCGRAGVTRSRREAAIVRTIHDEGVSPIWRERRTVEMYREGMSINQVAERLGVTPSVVIRNLRRRGIRTRTQREGILIRKNGSMSAYIARVQRISRMYHREGMRKGEIVEATGHTYATVAAALESKYNPYAGSDERGQAEEDVRALFAGDDYISNFARSGDGLTEHRLIAR